MRGLTAVLEKCPQVWDTFTIKPPTAQEIKEGKARPSIKLAVDGFALLYYLYVSNNFNCVCGGQYAQFAECTCAYISNLRKCGFSLFVVMDGTKVPMKQAVAMQRENDLIKTIKQLTCSEKSLGKKALPVMARQVFVDVLQAARVKVAFADGEADKVVAAMAKMYCCYAVSKDSDFFIFDLPGYIPVDNLDIARSGSVVTAKRFLRPKFCAELKLNVTMLPLLASAIGNDYVSDSLLRPFHVSLWDLDEVEFPDTWNMGDKEPTVRDQIIVRVASFLTRRRATRLPPRPLSRSQTSTSKPMRRPRLLHRRSRPRMREKARR